MLFCTNYICPINYKYNGYILHVHDYEDREEQFCSFTDTKTKQTKKIQKIGRRIAEGYTIKKKTPKTLTSNNLHAHTTPQKSS